MDAYFVLYEAQGEEFVFTGWFEASYSYNDSTETLDIAAWLTDNIDRGRFKSNGLIVGIEGAKRPEWDSGEEDTVARMELWPDATNLEFFDNLPYPYLTAAEFLAGTEMFSEYSRGWRDAMEGNPRASYDPDYMMGFEDANGEQDLMDSIALGEI